LNNAWQTFLMGLSNNAIIKGAVDLLTGILTSINNIINAISGGSGLIKSILSLGAAMGALAVGKALLGKILGGIGTSLG
jgi:hypothetical protein